MAAFTFSMKLTTDGFLMVAQNRQVLLLRLMLRSQVFLAASRLVKDRDRETYQSKDPESLIWWSKHIKDLTVLPRDDLPIHEDGCVNGIAYETFCINPRLHLQFLLSSCIRLGAECRTQHISSLSALLKTLSRENVRAIINCVGLGAGALVGDASVFPTKGQVVIVKGHAEHATTRLGDGFEALVIPRPGPHETLHGGCRIENDWYRSLLLLHGRSFESSAKWWCRSPDADEATTQTILDRCRSIAPDLLDEQGDFEVLRVEVGLRPSRHLGPRVEIENLHRGGPGGVQFPFVCHNYGHHSPGSVMTMKSLRALTMIQV